MKMQAGNNAKGFFLLPSSFELQTDSAGDILAHIS